MFFRLQQTAGFLKSDPGAVRAAVEEETENEMIMQASRTDGILR